MITGMHAIVFSSEAEKVRAFFGEVLGPYLSGCVETPGSPGFTV